MEKLLQWAVSNSDAQGLEDSRKNVQNLDPEIIDIILGKDEPTRMKELIQIIRNRDSDENVRLEAFDELEMIVEGVDNASNMEKMNLWPDIFDCISSSESVEVIRFALWIIGTCAQNNPETQKALLEKHSIFERLLALWSNAQIRPKIMYALTALLSNHPMGLEDFVTRDGFKVLEVGSLELDELMRKKMKFLLTVLGNEIGPDSLRCLLANCSNLTAIFDEPEESDEC